VHFIIICLKKYIKVQKKPKAKKPIQV